MKKSKKNMLNTKDLVKAFIMSIIAPVLVVLQQAADTHTLTDIHWKAVGMAAVAGGAGYLLKNFLTNSNDEFLKKER